MPRWAQSVRFRLSLNYALVVFATGCAMVVGLYLWQARQLGEPTVSGRPLVLVDPRTGARTPTPWVVLTRDERQMQALERFERAVNAAALDSLRRSSLVAVAGMALASFGAGWLLSGWALRPVLRISAFARHISATDLSQRIAMRGPDDELKELADTFDGMLDRLQEAFESQRRFVHEASHELRNPLSVVQANLELVLDGSGSDGEDALRSVAVAHRATSRLSQLVDDLLVCARADAPSVERDVVDLSALAAEAAADFAAPARARRLEVVAGGDPGVVVTGDEPALRRAVANLVANAVRLAPPDTTVTISVRRDGPWAVLTVADEGPGIAPEHRGKVFERFWRGPEHRNGAGSGLGLTLVDQIARRHGGEVTLDSEVGSGSVFTVRLPASERP